jgi:hypothetical protein
MWNNVSGIIIVLWNVMLVRTISRTGGKQWLKLAAILTVIAVSIWFTFWRLHQANTLDKKPDIYLYCTECLSTYQPKERLGGEQPRICDRCGKRAAWYAMQCNECGEIFGYITMIEQQGKMIRVQPVCPKCGTGNFSRYDGNKTPTNKLEGKNESNE